MNWLLKEIKAYCGTGAELNTRYYDNRVSGISIDTRTLKPGDIFIALEGENTDGHNWLPEAFSKGASAAIVNKDRSKRKSLGGDQPLLLVDQTLDALQNWAREQRKTSKYSLVAVTGSNGKTSTKEMIYKVLSKRYRAERSKGNLNNHIGLPLSVLSFNRKIQAGIVEMGANHIGEIDNLTKIAQPDIAVITNAGYAHVGLFGSIKNIAKTKLEIANGLRDDGVMVIDADDPNIQEEASKTERNRILFSVKDSSADIYAEDITFDGQALPSFKVKGINFRLEVAGIHSVKNALAAIAVGVFMGTNLNDISSALSTYKAVNGRWSERKTGGILIINDAYNANPSSLSASLETFGNMEIKGRRFAVLGDMLELGDYSDRMHFDMGQKAIKNNIDFLCVYGDFAVSVLNGVVEAGGDRERCKVIREKENIFDLLKENLRAGDAVLFKGSQKMRLGDIADKLEYWLGSAKKELIKNKPNLSL